MTLKKFYLILVVQAVVLTAMKVWFFRDYNYQDSGNQVLFIGALSLAVIIFIRAVGVMSFFEALIVVIFWLILDLLLDVLITSSVLGTSIFAEGVLWSSYGATAFVVFALHKKRHVHIRKQNIAKKHALAHAHEHGHEHPKH